MEKNDIVVYKNVLGIALHFDSDEEEIFRYRKINQNTSIYDTKSDFPIIDVMEVREATREELNLFLKCETNWLGKPIKVHRIRDYQFVEYIKPDTKEILFNLFVGYQSINRSSSDLDSALIEIITYKYDGSNSQAAEFFLRMIGYKVDKQYNEKEN